MLLEGSKIWSCIMKKLLRKLSTVSLIDKNVDLVFAVIVFAIGIMGIYLAIKLKWKYFTIGLPFIMSSVLYYLCKRGEISNSFYTFNFTNIQKQRVLKIANILLLLVFCIGLLEVHNTKYEISNIFIVSVLLLVFFILIGIALQEYVWFSLIKIIMLSYYIQMTTLFEFPGFIGIDPVFHAEMISRVIEKAHVVPYNQYFYYPIMQVLVAVTSLIANIGIKDSAAVSISFPYTFIEICLIYLIGILLYDRTIALIGGLIFGVSNIAFRYGSYVVTPTTLGIILFSLIIYFLFKSFLRGHRMETQILLLFTFLIQVITHTISTFITVIIQFSLILFDYIYSKFFGSKISKITNIHYLVFLLTATIAYWIFTSGFFGYVMRAIITNLSMDNLIGAYPMKDNPFSIRYFADYLDQILFYTFSIIGCLKILDIRGTNKGKFLHMSIGMLLLFIATVAIGFSLNAIIPDRWYVYALFILSIYMALGIMYVSKSTNSKVLNSLLVMAILLSITFFNITDTESNVDGRTDVNVLAIRKGLYESELISAKTIISKFDENPLTDSYYLLYITYNLNSNTKDSISEEDTLKLPTITRYLLDNNLNIPDKKFLIRKDLFSQPFIDFKGIAMISYDLDKALQESHRSLVYNSKTVFLYT